MIGKFNILHQSNNRNIKNKNMLEIEHLIIYNNIASKKNATTRCEGRKRWQIKIKTSRSFILRKPKLSERALDKSKEQKVRRFKVGQELISYGRQALIPVKKLITIKEVTAWCQQ